MSRQATRNKARSRTLRDALALLGLSVLVVAVLRWLGMPAALLVGPMLAAMVLSAFDGQVELPATATLMAQGVVGCLIARGIPVDVFTAIGNNWLIFAASVVGVTLVSVLLGWGLSHSRLLPGTTAIWGLLPGAATAMVLMSPHFGADMRLVAVMQYLRIVVVTVVASLVMLVSDGPAVTVAVATPAMAIATATATPPAGLPLLPFALTLVLAFGGAWLGKRLRLPAGAMLVPLVLGVLLQDFAGMQIILPAPLLALAYALVGWSIGLRFTRPLLKAAARVLPGVLLSILALVAVCGGLAFLMVRFAGIDPLTAYLATSPGGADSIAIIAAGSPGVDVPFVVAMQTLRFLFVLLLAPALARTLSSWLLARAAARGPR